MKLYGTPPSHFTRKVRIVLQELGLPYEFIVLSGLMETGAEHFANNPLHQFPVLEDGERQLIESDLICEYLLENYGDEKSTVALYPKNGDRYADKKRLAIMNGGMGSGVKLIRAKRSNIPDPQSFVFFQQEAAALTAALAWLDADLGSRSRYDQEKLSLLDITLMCFAEWAVFRELMPTGQRFVNVRRFVDANCARPSFANTHPALEKPAR